MTTTMLIKHAALEADQSLLHHNPNPFRNAPLFIL